VKLCLQKQPENRPSAESLLKSCKDLWDKAKDSAYLVRTLKLDHPALHSSKSVDFSPAEAWLVSPERRQEQSRDSDSTRSSIRWNFDLGEEET